MTPIPKDDLPHQIGKQVHVEGWAKGATFRLVETDGVNAVIVTPKTKRRYEVAANRLTYIRANEPTN